MSEVYSNLFAVGCQVSAIAVFAILGIRCTFQRRPVQASFFACASLVALIFVSVSVVIPCPNWFKLALASSPRTVAGNTISQNYGNTHSAKKTLKGEKSAMIAISWDTIRARMASIDNTFSLNFAPPSCHPVDCVRGGTRSQIFNASKVVLI